MKNLTNRQESLKNKLTNPIFTPKEKSGYFVVVLLKDNRLVRISNVSSLSFKMLPPFDVMEIFPFHDHEIAVAFEKKVRYFYDKAE